MKSIKNIVVVAGEASGDLHAAHFIKPLLHANPHIEISGIGGQHMSQAGVTLINDLARYGVTGLTEVFRHIHVIRKAFYDIKTHLKTIKPDLLILIDYPGFNLRLAKYAKAQLGLTILYYISPQIWAWKANRLKTIQKYIDHMAVILPFEKPIYQQANVPVSFVGHPLVQQLEPVNLQNEAKKTLKLPQDKRILALLPGSRKHEIDKHMPILIKTASMLLKDFSDLHFVIPVAATLEFDDIKQYIKHKLPITLIHQASNQVVAASDCVIVASGTASLECALLEKPMCIIYKASWLSYMIATQVINVRYLGLCNLLQNKMIVPELLQYDCNSIELTTVARKLLSDKLYIEQMIMQLKNLKTSLSTHEADCSMPELVQNMLNNEISNTRSTNDCIF